MLDPRSSGAYSQLAHAYRFSGDYASAATADRISLDLQYEAGTLVMLALAHTGLGNLDDAANFLEQAEIANASALSPFRLSQIALGYGLMGRTEDAARLFAQFEYSAEERPVGDAVWARALLAIGEYEQMQERLESAVANRVATDLPTLTEFASNTWNVPVLDEPDIQALFGDLWNGD